jgi:hypothetical protein
MTERVFIILCIFARRALDMKKLEFAEKLSESIAAR